METKLLEINLIGRVIYGNGLGSRFGFPTANIDCSDSLPSDVAEGVYAGRCTLQGESYKVVVNIGRSPSVVEHGQMRVEVHIMGFSGNLYGRELAIRLSRFLRPERRFESFDLLREQILRDCQQVRDMDIDEL